MGEQSREELPGDHPAELHCTACDSNYWTDETMMNDCPHCHSHYDWEPA